ncbi:MAG TPA: c-type cytochrome [Noviherbaspirillum sp.]|uniref:c-type cytochrome n=1 Tax=Noviherbaspirillum sp. TaxID=1926288 RepID=UPI002B48A4B2|nr:c-type cytochrome [Noviherbaspirillum sp.]HJV85292.1 c-type cytochrome [Noviherbaspirillum sp.]
MSRFINSIAVLALAATSGLAFAEKFPNIGRSATPKEIAAWDIDVRPDFKGLPKGSGTVAKGQQVWEGKCASCHGTFGESNEVFTPIIGGTTPEDIKTGRVASLTNGRQPQKTTIMKVATVSTLWDFINRAMPWTAPKTLTTEEVYSVVAYILNMAEIVPDDFTLSNDNIAEVQKRMPNRNGMTTNHGMWDIHGKPDVKSVACMKNCPVDEKIHSTLPDVSRNAHGNIALQNRTFGEVRGADTTKPAPTGPLSAGKEAKASAAGSSAAAEPAGLSMAKKNACVACHGVENKIVGPGFNEIAAKYKGNASAEASLVGKIKSGGSGVWGSVPMPSQAHVKDDEIKTIVSWILTGAK